jgi:hypothetical protein
MHAIEVGVYVFGYIYLYGEQGKRAHNIAVKTPEDLGH